MTPELADFAGSWRVTRQIDDRMAGQTGSFNGRAVFDRIAGGLRYSEDGLLRLGANPPLRAERAYLWRSEGGAIVVDYADGRAFHCFDPAAGTATHHCAPDLYMVRYDFAEWPAWRTSWHVTGPRKDYTMVTTYLRA